MSIIDGQLQFWEDNTTFTAGVSDSVKISYDKGDGTIVTGNPRALGEPLEIVLVCTTAFTGTFNIDINYVSASASNLTTNQVIQRIIVDGATAIAEGATYRCSLDFLVADADASHIGLEVIVNSGTVTAGAMSAWIQRAGEDQSTIND